jgi:hypothetical protein
LTDSTDSRFSRRTFLAGFAAATASNSVAAEENPAFPPSLTDVNFRKLIEGSDLTYDKPVPRSEEGVPIGNGRMGSLVWTTPTQLRLQINRVDLYANNSATNSFFERHNDYCGGCSYVDIDFGGGGGDPFPATGFGQRLSVYDGTLSIEGKELTANALAWPAQDVMAIMANDRRPGHDRVAVTLQMLRYETKYFGQQLETFARDHIVTVQNRSHTAVSQLIVRGDRIALTQVFLRRAASTHSRRLRSRWRANPQSRVL